MSVLKVYNATKGKWEFVDTVSTGIIPSSVPLVDPKHDQLWLDTSSNDFQGSAINAKLDGIVDNLNLVEEKINPVYDVIGVRFRPISGSLLTVAINAPSDRISYFATGPDTTDLPEDTTRWKYSSGMILKRGSGVIKVILYAYDTNDFAINTYAGGAWVGWTIK